MPRCSGRSSRPAMLLQLLALASLLVAVRAAEDQAMIMRVAWAALNGPVPQPVCCVASCEPCAARRC
jgi:hypothetical protein